MCLAVTLALGGIGLSDAQAANQPDAATTAADATTLDGIQVRPQYDAQMRAIDFKRDASAIQDGVSSDSYGQFPDQNAAEAIQRVPGVSVTRDQGEGRYVVVRGLDPALNTVSVDGISIGTPESDTRSAPLDVIPAESTERLTVVKAPTPDMPGDSIGGAIQVESASAFDRKGRDLRAKLEADHQDLSGETSPKGSFNYSDIFNDTFGIALGVNYQNRDYQSDNIEVEYDEHDDVADELFPVEVQQRKYTINRERTGANLNLDWRPDADNSYFLRTLYSRFTDEETRLRAIIPLGEGDVTQTGAHSYLVEGIDPGDFGRRVRYRTKDEDALAISAGGENRRDGIVVDYRLGYTKTHEWVNDEIESRFDYDGSDDLSATVDTRRGIPRFEILDPAGDGWLRNDNYEFDRFVVSPKQVVDEEKSAEVNLDFIGDRISWKAGLKGRWRDRDVNVDERELRQGPGFSLGEWSAAAPDYRHGDIGDGVDTGAMNDYIGGHLDEYGERPKDVAANTEVSLIEDYSSTEDIMAAYLMATADFGALRVIAGARMENTQFHATGNQVDLEDEETIASISRREVSSNYTSVLPGLHLRYDAGNDWVYRGAYTETIARPSFGDISPRVKINRDDEEIETGNPELDPYQSQNLDFSLEHYINESGIFSLAVFGKRIGGYIVNTLSQDNPDFPGYEVLRPVNGGDADVYGLELNWQQQLDFLPSGWDGLLVGFSGTWLDTSFDASIDGRDQDDFKLPRASDQIYSASIGYEKNRLSARLAAVYRSEYLDTIGDDARYDIYVAPNTQFDFYMSYEFSKNWSLFLQGSNLLDEPLELYQGESANTLQNELYGRSYALGIKIKL
ncbi:TonB-dependent receptor [Pseudoxanthomonas dokdonensis]|uniref:TonB-dependent receptor n=1 Tax=Pseudoxanthomonas dokdonensis TaxID=344882 RepID=A0A0R0CTN5_9GAMM|nr:TonB-dependent receptor [Pseudoxanthomonas dokdonensis]